MIHQRLFHHFEGGAYNDATILDDDEEENDDDYADGDGDDGDRFPTFRALN